MSQELVVLLDTEGNSIGTAEKLATHHSKTPLHSGFSCYIFNDKGKFLFTQRAHVKKVWPDVWTNSVCGHPAPGEDVVDAIKRRLLFELGITASDFKPLLPDYRYKTPPYNGIIENEICPVYIARTTVEPKPNPSEVDDVKWMSWQDYEIELGKDQTDTYSWWCKDQLKQLKDHPLIIEYSQPVTS